MTSTIAARELFVRMERRLERLRRIDAGEAFYDCVAEMTGFFIGSYHFQNWLRSDPSVPEDIRGAVDGHVQANRCLRLCADYCHGRIQLRIGRRGTAGNLESGGIPLLTSALNGEVPTRSVRFYVESDMEQEEVYQVATECVTAWDAFLSAHPFPE